MTAAVRAGFRNELHALVPLWSICTLTVIVCSMIGQPEVRGIAILAYGLGSCALGAHAFGHEYGHRTLPLLLSQPIDRRWLLAIKLATVMILVTLLGVVGYLTVLPLETRDAPATPLQVAGLVWIVSVILAPVLTLLCRGTLAGAIFSASLPAMFAVAGDLIGWYRFDADLGAIHRFQVAFFWRSMPPLFLVAAVIGWRSFMRLEAIEGRGREFHLPQWILTADTASARRRHPVWQLVAKELRLQQMVFAIAGIYVVVAALVLARQYMNPSFSAEVLFPLTFMYGALLAIVAGALASAEERQLKTLEAQLLLPIASSRQWLVKAGVVLGVALALAVVLPATLMVLLESRRSAIEPLLVLALTAPVLASASLYVSSLATSGVRALAMSAPFVTGGLSLVFWSERVTRGVLEGLAAYRISAAADFYGDLAAIILCAGFITLMLRYAHLNHRSGERSIRRIGSQVVCTASFVVVAGVLATLVAHWKA